MLNDLAKLEMKINGLKNRYSDYLEERERRRKREQDVHFTNKDQVVLIKSFLLASVIEQGIRKLFVI
jgi:hypothetical protein